MNRMLKPLISLAASLTLCAAHAQSSQDHFVGDVGALLSTQTPLVRGQEKSQNVLPYAYGDWGRFYARVDTLGLRVLPWGQGHVELVARLGMDGVQASKTAWPRLNDRSAPLPIGLGTFQTTPIGGLFAYLMHEPRSVGQFAEFSWAGRLALGSVTLYPQLGAQYRSSALVRHLYGVTPAEAAQTGLSTWQGERSIAPMATLHTEVPLVADWTLQLNVRHQWLDKAITDSPLVDSKTRTTGFLALTRSLK